MIANALPAFDFGLGETADMIRDSVAGFAADKISPRAAEIDADAILKGTNVDGVYTADPVLDPKAKRLRTVTYMDAIKNRLRVMDSTAFSLSMDNRLKMVVFKIGERGNIRKIVLGEEIGTLVKEDSQ